MIWAGVICCLFISFMFSGIEAGILSLNRVRLRYHVEKKDPAAITLEKLLKHPGRLLGTVLLVTNLMNLLALVLAVRAATELAGAWGYLWVFGVALPVNLVLVELLPKALFRRFPYRALAMFAGPLRMAYIVLGPILGLAASFIRKLMPPDATQHPGQILLAREEFKDLTAESEKAGALSEVERRMIHSVVDFRNVKVKEVMIPMEKVISVRQDTSRAELMKLARTTKIDRFPVLDEQGNIVGLVNILDMLLEQERNATAYNYLRRIVTASGEEAAYSLIRRLRAARLTLASVLDVDGKPVGIVSSEEIIDRLVKSALSPKQEVK